MTATEWLFIGGPANGKKQTILYGTTSVKWASDNGKEWLYQGHTYLYRDHMFCIGVFDANDVDPRKVERMIDETRLRAICRAEIKPNAEIKGAR